MYRFIESIKIEDQKPYLLDLHQQRMNDTFRHFGKDSVMDIATMYQNLEHDEDGLYKWRILYDLDGNFESKLIPYAISEIENFELVVADDLDYSFKYEDRKELEKMKSKSRCEEIMIVKNGYIADTSYSNVLFLKNKNWFTPSTYLLNGVQRQHLLKNKKIKEAEISLSTLKEYSHFQLINALNDFDDMFVYPITAITNLSESTEYLEL